MLECPLLAISGHPEGHTRASALPPKADIRAAKPCILSLWLVHSHPTDGDQKTYLIPLAVDADGQRVPTLEKHRDQLFWQEPKAPTLDSAERLKLLGNVIDPMLQREVQHRGIAAEQGGYAVELVGWVEVS